jgi:hypothetical protein
MHILKNYGYYASFYIFFLARKTLYVSFGFIKLLF